MLIFFCMGPTQGCQRSRFSAPQKRAACRTSKPSRIPPGTEAKGPCRFRRFSMIFYDELLWVFHLVLGSPLPFTSTDRTQTQHCGKRKPFYATVMFTNVGVSGFQLVDTHGGKAFQHTMPCSVPRMSCYMLLQVEGRWQGSTPNEG